MISLTYSEYYNIWLTTETSVRNFYTKKGTLIQASLLKLSG